MSELSNLEAINSTNATAIFTGTLLFPSCYKADSTEFSENINHQSLVFLQYARIMTSNSGSSQKDISSVNILVLNFKRKVGKSIMWFRESLADRNWNGNKHVSQNNFTVVSSYSKDMHLKGY